MAVLPGDPLAGVAELQGAADAGLVLGVHAAADGAADEDARDRPADGGGGIALADLAADHAAGDAADGGAHQFPVAVEDALGLDGGSGGSQPGRYTGPEGSATIQGGSATTTGA